MARKSSGVTAAAAAAAAAAVAAAAENDNADVSMRGNELLTGLSGRDYP